MFTGTILDILIGSNLFINQPARTELLQDRQRRIGRPELETISSKSRDIEMKMLKAGSISSVRNSGLFITVLTICSLVLVGCDSDEKLVDLKKRKLELEISKLAHESQPADFELQNYGPSSMFLVRFNKRTGATHVYHPSNGAGGWMYVKETDWQTASKEEIDQSKLSANSTSPNIGASGN